MYSPWTRRLLSFEGASLSCVAELFITGTCA